MDKTTYINILIKKHQNNFKIYKNHNLLGNTLDLYAHFKDIGGRTLITPKDVIDKFEINEHCIVKSFNTISTKDIENFSSYLKSLTVNLVKPHNEHKSSNITGIVLCENEVPEEIISFTNKFKYTKYYKLYFQGFSEIKLLLIDLKNEKIYSNKKGKELKKIYAPTKL